MKMEYIFIKQKDEYCVSQEMFRNFLCVNKRIEFKNEEDNKSDIIIFDGKKLEYGLESTEVEKFNEMIFHLMVEMQGDGEAQADILEHFDFLIKEINEKNGTQFAINTIWNDVSSYYGKKLYPDISKVENMLRKIIYLFMLKTVGSKWIDVGTPEKFQTSINNVIEKNNKTKNDINAEWLTYADFITLGYFFTAPYSMKTDLKVLFKELKQYESFDALSDGEKQADDEVKKENKEKGKVLTADVIRKMSDEYEPKNNWDRYFSDKLSVKGPNKFSKDWGSLYDIRNKVAHGKPINKANFKKANELIELFTTAFDECIEIIDTLEMTVEEAEAVEAVAQQVVMQKEQPDTFERENFSARIKSYPYSVKLNSEALSGGLKITGDAIKATGFSSVSDFALSMANTLSSAFGNLTDIRGPITGAQGVTPTLSALTKSSGLAINSEGLLKRAERMSEMLAPLSSQVNVSSGLSEALNAQKIAAALDKPIVIDSPISKMMINENINLVAKPKEDFLDGTEIKIGRSYEDDKDKE